MKGLFSLLSLMLFMTGFAQDTTHTVNSDQEMQTTQFNASTSAQPASFMLNDEEYRFIPEELGYRIARMEDGREVDYGSLRQTTDDGYYVMTSMINDHVSYGRFDESGNFKALRYDEKSDQVIEENFIISHTTEKVE